MSSLKNYNIDFAKSLIKLFPKAISEIKLTHGETICIVQKDCIIPFFTFLKLHSSCSFEEIVDITAVDYPSREKRFDVVYQFLSIHHSNRLVVKVPLGVDDAIPSVTKLYRSAIWLERETWDMFGVFFANHPDLRRILTDYGFQGYPLRKDFPLSGYFEVRYDDEEKRIVYEPVELTQEFRMFDALTPWEPTV